MTATNSSLISDTLYFLAAVLIAFGLGYRLSRTIETSYYARPIIYSVFILVSYKLLIYDRHR